MCGGNINCDGKREHGLEDKAGMTEVGVKGNGFGTTGNRTTGSSNEGTVVGTRAEVVV